MPADQAKDLRAGMDAEILPTTVRREEYGFIRGKVTFVSDYPATEAATMRVFENAPLVQALSSRGPGHRGARGDGRRQVAPRAATVVVGARGAR